jgi:DNA-directed RNA polymerase subunit RPC12/RpoP
MLTEVQCQYPMRRGIPMSQLHPSRVPTATLLSVLLLGLAGCGKTGDTRPVKVAADALFDAYGKDVMGADKKYTGRLIEIADVTGKVEKDDRGRYYVVAAQDARLVTQPDRGPRSGRIEDVGAHAREAAFNAEYQAGVILFLDPKTADKFAGLDGKRVTLRGTCHGMTKDKKTEPAYFVTVDDCELVAEAGKAAETPKTRSVKCAKCSKQFSFTTDADSAECPHCGAKNKITVKKK